MSTEDLQASLDVAFKALVDSGFTQEAAQKIIDQKVRQEAAKEHREGCSIKYSDDGNSVIITLPCAEPGRLTSGKNPMIATAGSYLDLPLKTSHGDTVRVTGTVFVPQRKSRY